MPSTLHKTRKQISKKRGGVVNALHQKSRDSLRLHKAGVRDQRIEKLAAARSKQEQPLVDRVAFFQQALRPKEGEALSLEELQKLINSFVHQYDEEFDAVKKTRRPGRPASAQEDLLKVKIEKLETEYQQGFSLPDILTPDTAKQLILWEGSWAYLTQLKWIKVSSAGHVRPTSFPSGGIN